MLKDILEEYGNVKLKFEYYTKYVFTFTGLTEDGILVTAGVGGDSDDIYRFDVDASKEVTLNTLHPSFIDVSKGKEILASWDNF